MYEIPPSLNNLLLDGRLPRTGIPDFIWPDKTLSTMAWMLLSAATRNAPDSYKVSYSKWIAK